MEPSGGGFDGSHRGLRFDFTQFSLAKGRGQLRPLQRDGESK